jgi:hypothetical protein
MLSYPTIDQLNSMRLTGMAKGLRAQLENPESHNCPCTGNPSEQFWNDCSSRRMRHSCAPLL